MKRLIIIPLLILSPLLIPTQAHASDTQIVYVDVVASSAWPTTYPVGWIDQYTGSDMRIHSCVYGRKCIKIREKLINSSWGALTYGATGTYSRFNVVTIYLNPQRRNWSWTLKAKMIAHELGHANGITWHSSYCSQGIMYYRIPCTYGPPWRFTYAQRIRLRSN